ncbi:MAG: S9 family peptidase [Steroidobacteraceae bacterium]|jgi:dipeptidyl aminopeptidase/acylaminoacyl peptidase|nr:S9 family peptidase [Steroidobacteraceae bacterium]
MALRVACLAATAVAALLAHPCLAQPGPGQGPDPALEAITPSAEPINVGLAGEYPADIARYILANGVLGASISPDGRHVAAMSLVTGVRQLWIVPTDGGPPRQLTFGNGVTGWRWAPDGQSLVYAADNDGNEQEGYYRISVDGAREQLVVAAERGAFRMMGDVLPDNRRIVFASTERNGLDFDIYVRNLETGEQRRVFEGKYAWYPQSVSPDGRWLVMSQGVGEDSDNLFLVDLEHAETKPLSQPKRRANHTAGGFAWLPDASGFYFATNDGREFAAIERHDLKTGRRTLVEAAPFDIQNVRLCGPGGRYLLWTTNEDGFFRVHGRDLETDRSLAVPALPEGVYSVSCPLGSGAASITVNGWATPGDLVVWDLASGSARTVWASNLAGLDPARFVRPESIRMKARDGVELQGLLYLPRADARRGEGPPPVVFDVHGGPTGQSVASYSASTQYLVNRGIAVFEPNVRGSTGFGHTYVTLDDRERRLDSIRDLVDMLAYFRRDGRVDAGRAAVTGGSYGGYAVNAVLAAYQGEFVAGVSLYGVADWVTGLEVASPALKASDLIEYGDITDPKWREFYQEISPIRQAGRIRVPVLYSHGVQDPRIDIFETETMVRTLRANGIEAPYIRFNDEGHGWRKLSNRLFYARREAEFLERQLSVAAAAAGPAP